MTTLFLAMLAIIVIIACARYYGSPKVANNLLLTLAMSVVVGLGIKYVANINASNKKDTRIEKVTMNHQPMQSTANFATVANPTVTNSTVSLSGIAGKENIDDSCNWKRQTTGNNIVSGELDIGDTESLDSS